MLAKTIANYGGPKSNGKPVEDPETDISDDEYNLLIEDSAQATQTVGRAWVRFPTVAGGSPPFDIPSTTIVHDTAWGSGASSRPTVTKTATGRYTITFPASQVDGLGETEIVSFRHVLPCAVLIDNPPDPADEVNVKVLSLNGNGINIKTIQENVAPPVLADVGNSSGNPFEVQLALR